MNTVDIFSRLVIHLFKSVLYQDKHAELWIELLNKQAGVREYIAVLGLELFIDESEGFAFLRQKYFSEEENKAELPRLVQRRALSFPVSLLCMLLRKKLIENDSSGESTRVILSFQQIMGMMLLFLPDRSNEVKTVELVETCINKMLEFGFLRCLKTTDEASYEIQRIIKAFIDADWLNQIDSNLQKYLDYGQSLAS